MKDKTPAAAFREFEPEANRLFSKVLEQTMSDESGQPKWEITVETENYGKLVCSYFPSRAQHTLMDYFKRVFLASDWFDQTPLTQDGFEKLDPQNAMGHPIPLTQYMYAVAVLFEQLPLVLKDALRQAGHETISRVLIELDGRTHDNLGVAKRDIIELALKPACKAAKKRMGAPARGGSRRKGKAFGTQSESESLVTTVDSLRELWDFITDFFSTNDYDAGCITMLRGSAKFKELSRGYDVPDRLLKRVFRRQDKERNDELEPVGFAIEHARHLLGIRNLHSTVRTKYYAGKKRLNSLGERFPE